MAIFRMHNGNMHYNPYYINSSVIVDLAIGVVLRSTERILFFANICLCAWIFVHISQEVL